MGKSPRAAVNMHMIRVISILLSVKPHTRARRITALTHCWCCVITDEHRRVRVCRPGKRTPLCDRKNTRSDEGIFVRREPEGHLRLVRRRRRRRRRLSNNLR